jgi:Sec-independent protein translocase protein TatA|tara:strand:- start:198 stop:467 length:270 start_codon:yes stop_codon:yes gene_type:complete
MNSPGLLELVVIVFLLSTFLGPEKVKESARAIGKAYREFRGYSNLNSLGNNEITDKENIRSSAEKLGINTAGMNSKEIKNAIIDELSNE